MPVSRCIIQGHRSTYRQRPHDHLQGSQEAHSGHSRGCTRKRYCKLEKREYLAKFAHKAYRDTLVESRTGIALSKESFYENDAIISEGIQKGQHLYHILQTRNLSVSKSTFYRHLHLGYLSVAPIDMPRVVKFKPRRPHAKDYIPAKLKQGRTFDCFESYIEENNIDHWVEMDLIIGRPGGKTIMTFDFTFCNFMFGILLDNKSSAAVSAAIRTLKARLLENDLPFASLFPVLLTDNGGEFSDIFAFENDPNGKKVSSLFFCDPHMPSQKPRVEKNHTIFRDIVPPGSSFDDFSQNTVDLIFSHVNAIARKSLNGKSPYDVFAFAFGASAASALGIDFVPASEVIQSPLLLKLAAR